VQGLSKGLLSGLIGSIYDCALDPAKWEPTLATVAEALDFQTALLSLEHSFRGA
jgi:hypothetical protein